MTIPLPALRPLGSQLSNLPFFMFSTEPLPGQKKVTACSQPDVCPEGSALSQSGTIPALCLLSARSWLCVMLVFWCSWFWIALHRRLELSLSLNSCDMSKLHYLETVGSGEKENGAKWLKQNISAGSYGYALPPGSTRWVGLAPPAPMASRDVASFEHSLMSTSGGPENLMTAITALKVCLFAYKPTLKWVIVFDVIYYNL